MKLFTPGTCFDTMSSATAGNVRIARSGSIFINSPGKPATRSPSRSPRRAPIDYNSQLASPSPSRTVPRLTAVRLQQKLVELDQENLSLKTQNESLQKRLKDANERQTAGANLNSRLFHEIEKLSATKAKLDDENKRSKIALSASSRSVVQTLLEKEQVQVHSEHRLQSKIAENLHLAQTLRETQAERDTANSSLKKSQDDVARLEQELKAAKEHVDDLKQKLSQETQSRHALVQSTLQLTNKFESRLVAAEGQLLVSAERSVARQKQAQLEQEIQQQRAKLLHDMGVRVRVLEDNARELETDNAELSAKLATTQRELQASQADCQEKAADAEGALKEAAQLKSDNEDLRRERDLYRNMTLQLSESSGALTRMLDDVRSQREEERNEEAELAEQVRDKVHSLLDASYILGYRVYEDTEMMSRSILSPYGGRLPSFSDTGSSETESPRFLESQSPDEWRELGQARPAALSSSPAAGSGNNESNNNNEEGGDDSNGDAESEEALLKFRELDQDNSGSLKGPEMKRLAQWVMEGFGQTDSGQRLGKRIMERLDANGDSQLQFDEFKEWFEEKQAQMKRLQERRR